MVDLEALKKLNGRFVPIATRIGSDTTMYESMLDFQKAHAKVRPIMNQPVLTRWDDFQRDIYDFQMYCTLHSTGLQYFPQILDTYEFKDFCRRQHVNVPFYAASAPNRSPQLFSFASAATLSKGGTLFLCSVFLFPFSHLLTFFKWRLVGTQLKKKK